jgi:aspartyl protease
MSAVAWRSRPAHAGCAAIALLTCTNAFAALVIPIEIEKGNPIADVRINGVATRLIIDSGGGILVLKSGAIERAGALRTGDFNSSTDALGNTSKQDLYSLGSLEIGGKSFRNLVAERVGAYAADSPGDGSMGRDFLNRFVAIYDYGSGRITLFDSGELSAARRSCRGESVRILIHPEGVVVTKAMAERHAMRVLWDTGAQHSFIKKSFADERLLPIETPFYTAPTFELGRADFGPLRFVVIDFAAPTGVDGFVGFNFFADHVVCIDPFARVVKVRKR